MATKEHPGEFDCFAAAADDEPIFTCRANDDDMPDVVEDWARRRFERVGRMLASAAPPQQDYVMRQLRKIAEALRCANDARDWKRRQLVSNGEMMFGIDWTATQKNDRARKQVEFLANEYGEFNHQRPGSDYLRGK